MERMFRSEKAIASMRHRTGPEGTRSHPITGATSERWSPHRNRLLFSDHFLDARLPLHPAWSAGEAGAGVLLQRVAEILATFNASAVEAQTEKDLVQPVLDALGWPYEVQPTLAAGGRTVRPDYVFYRDAAAVAAAKGKKLSEGTRSEPRVTFCCGAAAASQST